MRIIPYYINANDGSNRISYSRPMRSGFSSAHRLEIISRVTAVGGCTEKDPYAFAAQVQSVSFDPGACSLSPDSGRYLLAQVSGWARSYRTGA